MASQPFYRERLANTQFKGISALRLGPREMGPAPQSRESSSFTSPGRQGEDARPRGAFSPCSVHDVGLISEHRILPKLIGLALMTDKLQAEQASKGEGIQSNAFRCSYSACADRC